jgi:hypothetical protein
MNISSYILQLNWRLYGIHNILHDFSETCHCYQNFGNYIVTSSI